MTNFGELHTCEQIEAMTAVGSAVSPPQYSNKSDPFSVSRDGNFIGQDGFIVPKNFGEFYAKYPKYVRRWAIKRLGRVGYTDAIRDLEQDMLVFLFSLPKTSKFREPSEQHPHGCTDVIQCFNPWRQYGASERRWRCWLNLCLSNRASTIYQRQKKDALSRKNNMPFDVDSEGVTVDEEYLHSHSETLRRKSAEQSSAVEKRLLANQFIDFVLEKEPRLYGTVLAISETRTLRDAQELLRVDETALTRDLTRIIQLKDAFIDGGPIPKQRKPYRKRGKVHASSTPSTIRSTTITAGRRLVRPRRELTRRGDERVPGRADR
ncbi:MAG: hypothetical protein LAN61_04880 [Acidobacteriia bacterium]|nr:hypothetical protein [Terriglobia bacterium]